MEIDHDIQIDSARFDGNLIADNPAALGDEGVKKVTRPINAGYMGLSERQQFKREISIVFDQCYSSGCSDD